MASGIVNGTANNPQKTAKAKETDAMRLDDCAVTSGYVVALGVPLAFAVGSWAPNGVGPPAVYPAPKRLGGSKESATACSGRFNVLHGALLDRHESSRTTAI